MGQSVTKSVCTATMKAIWLSSGSRIHNVHVTYVCTAAMKAKRQAQAAAMQKQRQAKIMADKERQAQAREKATQTRLRNAAEKAAQEAAQAPGSDAEQDPLFQQHASLSGTGVDSQEFLNTANGLPRQSNHTNGYHSNRHHHSGSIAGQVIKNADAVLRNEGLPVTQQHQHQSLDPTSLNCNVSYMPLPGSNGAAAGAGEDFDWAAWQADAGSGIAERLGTRERRAPRRPYSFDDEPMPPKSKKLGSKAHQHKSIPKHIRQIAESLLVAGPVSNICFATVC